MTEISTARLAWLDLCRLRQKTELRIRLNLDDGVKVNYGKFGDLLEGVKLVTGGMSEAATARKLMAQLMPFHGANSSC